MWENDGNALIADVQRTRPATAVPMTPHEIQAAHATLRDARQWIEDHTTRTPNPDLRRIEQNLNDAYGRRIRAGALVDLTPADLTLLRDTLAEHLRKRAESPIAAERKRTGFTPHLESLITKLANPPAPRDGMEPAPQIGDELAIDGYWCHVYRTAETAGVLHVYGLDHNDRTRHMVDSCRNQCAHRPAYTLAVTVTVVARFGRERRAIVGRGATAEYAFEDATVHAYALAGHGDVVVSDRWSYSSF